jgi:hypothetical protein
MEYIEGAPVVSQKKPQPMPLPGALRLAIQIADALKPRTQRESCIGI